MTHDELVAYYGSQAEAARQLNASPQVVSAWKVRGSIPLGWQRYIELATKGVLKQTPKDRSRSVAA